MEFKGVIIEALQPRKGVSSQGKEWVTQDFVIEETDQQYPKKMTFNVFGEDKLKEFNIRQGQTGTVKFDINAREYNGRWYNDVRAWGWDASGNAPGTTQAQPAVNAEEAFSQSSDGLPF